MLAAALAVAALGTVPDPPDPPCTTLLGTPTPRTFAAELPDGTRVTLVDRYGGYVSGECDRARTFTFPEGGRSRPVWRFSWATSDAADETGPPLASASTTLAGVTAALTRTTAGRIVGRLLVTGTRGNRAFSLRAPRRADGTAVLRSGRPRVALRLGRAPPLLVDRLPGATRAASVRFTGAGRDLLRLRACAVRARDVLHTPDGQVARLKSGFRCAGRRA